MTMIVAFIIFFYLYTYYLYKYYYIYNLIYYYLLGVCVNDVTEPGAVYLLIIIY